MSRLEYLAQCLQLASVDEVASEVSPGVFVYANVSTRMALHLASTALAALRDPTPEMVDAGCRIEFACPGPRIFTPSKWMRKQWQAMIDAALK